MNGAVYGDNWKREREWQCNDTNAWGGGHASVVGFTQKLALAQVLYAESSFPRFIFGPALFLSYFNFYQSINIKLKSMTTQLWLVVVESCCVD